MVTSDPNAKLILATVCVNVIKLLTFCPIIAF